MTGNILTIFSGPFRLILPAIAIMSLHSCRHNNENANQAPLFTLLPAEMTHAKFVNHLDYEKQLEMKFNIYTYRNFYNGGGVAIGDINNDGLPDVYLTANMGPNTLYLNRGNFVFEDISQNAGIQGKGEWSTGVSMADVNGDGWLDIYVCNSGNQASDEKHNELFMNNGDLTFTERAAEYAVNDSGYSTHAGFFDYDKDGDLDLYLMNNSSKAIGSFKLEENQRNIRDYMGGDKLFRNDGNRFTDVSEQAGIYGSVIGFGLGITLGDIDLDGWVDIYISNDFFERDYIYMNKGDGTFREVLTDMMPSTSAASMGADMADINNDRYPEVFATDMVPEFNDRLKTKTTFDNWEGYHSNVQNGYHHQFTRNMLHINNADGTFSEVGRFAGVNATDWSWGALIVDLDNDGMKDLFVANGIYQDLTDQDYIQYFSDRDRVMSIVTGKNVDYKTLIDAIPSVKLPNYAFQNQGNFRFANVADKWGLAQPSHSNGSAYGDLDNDGDLDLVVNNVNMPVFIYRNETNQLLPGNRYLKVVLNGIAPNTHAIGAKVTGVHKGKYYYTEQLPTRGFLSTIDARPNLGLGAIVTLDTLVVEWPDNRVTLLTQVATNKTLTLSQANATVQHVSLPKRFGVQNRYLTDISGQNRITFVHRENDFNDFSRESLLYHMMSTEGPCLCQADVNNDGLHDVYIGGAKDQAGELLVQLPGGTFRPLKEKVFESDRVSEDTDCAFFDADGDSDLDLYVASGGNELPESSSALSDRLYLNNGSGRFTRSPQVLPAGRYESSACVKPADYDADGITELFVGIRLKPFLYGIPVNGYLLENDGKGNFSNVTDTKAPGLKNMGMIRDMQWMDADGDGDPDMIIAGEWMPLRVFLNANGVFAEDTLAFGTQNTSGWWNCLLTGDFDSDGDVDFLAGNHGLNSRFRATPERPVSMYVNDFDLDGNAEQIICAYNGDQSYPLALKHDLTRQIPVLTAKFPKYELYKDVTVTDIFTPQQLEKAVYLNAVLLETSLFLNNGHGKFTRVPLPDEVQYSSVYAGITGDFNHDGLLDILLGGNLHEVKPEVGRYDASYGHFLAGNGKGEFTNLPARETGLLMKGQVRAMALVPSSRGTLLVVAKSNAPVQVFYLQEP